LNSELKVEKDRHAHLEEDRKTCDEERSIMNSTLTMQLEDKQKQLFEAKTKQNNLEVVENKLSGEVAELEQRVANCVVDISRLNADIAHFNNAIEHLNNDIKDKDKDIAGMNIKLTALCRENTMESLCDDH